MSYIYKIAKINKQCHHFCFVERSPEDELAFLRVTTNLGLTVSMIIELILQM
jgi:hypothetical protein